jgi:hypothetical protein
MNEDPGKGLMDLVFVTAAVVVVYFFLRGAWIWLRSVFAGG